MRKKGISLVSLSIAIVVLMALVSTITISLTFSINNAKKMSFAKEIYNIQSLVDEYIQKEDTTPKTLEVVEITPTDVIQFSSETLTNGKLLLETLDLQSLGLNSTSYGNKEIGETDAEKSKDVYAISQATGKIYYIAGVNIGGKKYYTLTDELRQMIEKNQELNIAEETITFTPNKVGWSKDAITLKVTVPSGYTSPSVSINNTNIQYSTTTENGVTYYNINTSSVAESYTVTVNYTKGGVTSTASYTAKLDKTAPVISKDTNILDTVEKINGLKAVDSGSGIKYFKYAEDVISSDDVRQYMHAYGKDITNGSINFKKKQNYTLYAEDKSGNYTIAYIDVTGNVTNQVMPIGATVVGYNNYLTSKTVETSGNENTSKPNEGNEDWEEGYEFGAQSQNISNKLDFVWKYIGVNDEGKIIIIPDVDSNTPKIRISGKGGFLNGPNILNDLCDKLYSTSIGKARSINEEDIIDFLEYTGYMYSYYDKDNNFIKVKEPLTVGELLIRVGETTLKTTATPDGSNINDYVLRSVTIKRDSSEITTNEQMKKLIFQSQKYWIAAQRVRAYLKNSNVGFFVMNGGYDYISGVENFWTFNKSYGSKAAIRPVVELDSNVTLLYDSATNTCSIVTN